MRLMRPSWEGAAAVPDDAPSDAELWARGDESAFGELYDRYAEAVWNHAYRLTASWSTAEDLTSATFLNLVLLPETLIRLQSWLGLDKKSSTGKPNRTLAKVGS